MYATTRWQQYCVDLDDRLYEAAVWRGTLTSESGENLCGTNYADISEAHDQYTHYAIIHGCKAASSYRLDK